MYTVSITEIDPKDIGHGELANAIGELLQAKDISYSVVRVEWQDDDTKECNHNCDNDVVFSSPRIEHFLDCPIWKYLGITHKRN